MIIKTVIYKIEKKKTNKLKFITENKLLWFIWLAPEIGSDLAQNMWLKSTWKTVLKGYQDIVEEVVASVWFK